MAIHDRVNYRMVCTVHKALHNQMPEYIGDMFEYKTRTATRNTKECALKIPNRKLDISRRLLAYKMMYFIMILTLVLHMHPQLNYLEPDIFQNILQSFKRDFMSYYVILQSFKKVLNVFNCIKFYVTSV